ncbi:MAG: hypothetical protein RL693_2639 [Verrucomicrobiota bacterium]|jgi:multidrug efflux pump subunit AcrA (membrane-fusion protein)
MFFSKLVRYLTFIVALAGFVAITIIITRVQGKDQKMPPPPIAPPEKPYANTVAATGIIEALSENVAIGVPVAGLVAEVFVEVNDKVKADQPLFRIDDRDLQAQLIKLRSMVDVQNAKVEVQNANLAKAQDLLDRVKSVTDTRALSVDEVKARENDVRINQAQLLASKSELNASKADVRQVEMLVERLMVKAPKAGVILQLNTRAGEFAANISKSPLMVLGDLDRLQVRADVDEQNAVRVRSGQPATAYVKGDTKNPIQLQFIRVEPYVIPKVSLTGASTERVDTRVLQVIYSMQRPNDSPLYVGQQVDVYIDATENKKQP